VNLFGGEWPLPIRVSLLRLMACQWSPRYLTLACRFVPNYRGRMKLQQGQIWKCGEEYVRIVHLERLEVGYKSLKSLKSSEGTHQRTTKKAFCRMLKGASLQTDKVDSILK